MAGEGGVTPTKYIGQTVPVHVEVQMTEVVLAQPEMRAFLAAAKRIAVGECMCRRDRGAEACGRPLEVCLAIDGEASRNLETQGWRAISLEGALEVLEASHRAGLVHMAYRKPGLPPEIVCSCCACCCEPLRELRGRDYHDGYVESAYVARFDPASCVGCGQCAERCVFGAFTLPAGTDRATFDESKCFGCGLCASTCPSGAIDLIRRQA
ncbi:MAG: ATP-binding protein [Candidatus Bipolaricaulia bacterium]